MTIRKFWVGDLGPFLFDDTKAVRDPDDGYPGEYQIAFRGEAPVKAPEFIGLLVSSTEVTSIDDPSTELNALSASTVGSLIACYEINAGVVDEMTIYAWDTSYGSEEVPYLVDGSSGGGWVAIAGKYKYAGRSSVVSDASTSHSITDPADSPATADALRDDLVTNTIPSIESALDALGTKINSLIDVLQTAKIMGT